MESICTYNCSHEGEEGQFLDRSDGGEEERLFAERPRYSKL
jgi:hypothetical protein